MPTGWPLTAISTSPQKQWPVWVLISAFIAQSSCAWHVASSRSCVFLIALVVAMNDRASAFVDRASGTEPADTLPARAVAVRGQRAMQADPLSDVLKTV